MKYKNNTMDRECPLCKKDGLIAVQQAIRKNVFRCEYCLLTCIEIDEKYYYHDDNSNFLEEIL